MTLSVRAKDGKVSKKDKNKIKDPGKLKREIVLYRNSTSGKIKTNNTKFRIYLNNGNLTTKTINRIFITKYCMQLKSCYA